MTPLELQALAAAQREQFPFFLMKVFEQLHPGQPPLDLCWYLEAICHALDEVKEGQVPRLVITVPPRHLKSVTVAVAWAAWLLGRDPTMKIMVASYSEDLARLHAGLCRTVMESHWYKTLFAATRLRERGSRTLELVTTKGGSRKAISVGGSVTGHGADLIIIDDCMKADDARSPMRREELKGWYNNTLATRLNDKRSGRIVSIQQRLHEDDLPAMLLEQGYAHLNLPAIAEREEEIPIGPGRSHVRSTGDLLNPEREDAVVLERIRLELGPMVFSAQYLQDPVVPGGNMVRWEWFESYGEADEREHYEYVVQSWDTASSTDANADWSVCLTLGLFKKRWELLDLWRNRVTMPDLVRAAKRLHGKWHPNRILIENKGSGTGLLQTLDEALGFPGRSLLVPMSPNIPKLDRLDAGTPLLEGKLVMIPDDAPWLPGVKRELLAFPNGRYDDQVDALSQFLQWTGWRSTRAITHPPAPRRYPDPYKRSTLGDPLLDRSYFL